MNHTLSSKGAKENLECFLKEILFFLILLELMLLTPEIICAAAGLVVINTQVAAPLPSNIFS